MLKVYFPWMVQWKLNLVLSFLKSTKQAAGNDIVTLFWKLSNLELLLANEQN